MKPRALWGRALFFYGAFVHVVLFRALVHWRYPPPAGTSFVNHPLINIEVAILGGVFVSLLMLPLLRWAPQSGVLSVIGAIVFGGICATVATTLVLELLLVTAAVIVTASSASSGVSLFSFFKLSLLSVHTYSFDVFFEAVPFSVLYGVVAGALIPWMRGAKLSSA